MATREEIALAKKAKTFETIKEIVTIRNIFFKLDVVEDPENDALFVEMLNEIGFTNSYGKPMTYMGYRQMFERADQTALREFITSLTHEPIAIPFPG